MQCVNQMIMARVSNVKSGWKNIFSVITSGARDTHQSLVESAFAVVRRVMGHFALITEITDTIDECINCLVAFGRNTQFTDISLQAIEYLLKCAHHLGALGRAGGGEDRGSGGGGEGSGGGEVATTSSPAKPPASSGQQGGGGDGSLKVWFLLLTGLSGMVSDPRLEVRSRALQVLFNTLHSYGNDFKPATWRLIFQGVLFPIFDDVRHGDNSDFGGSGATAAGMSKHAFGPSWLQTTCLAALNTLVELFSRFFHIVSFLLPELLQLVNSCIQGGSLHLAEIGVKAWVTLLGSAGHKFGDREWAVFLRALASAFDEALPYELVSAKVRAPPPSPTIPSPFVRF